MADYNAVCQRGKGLSVRVEVIDARQADDAALKLNRGCFSIAVCSQFAVAVVCCFHGCLLAAASMVYARTTEKMIPSRSMLMMVDSIAASFVVLAK